MSPQLTDLIDKILGLNQAPKIDPITQAVQLHQMLQNQPIRDSYGRIVNNPDQPNPDDISNSPNYQQLAPTSPNVEAMPHYQGPHLLAPDNRNVPFDAINPYIPKVPFGGTMNLQPQGRLT